MTETNKAKKDTANDTGALEKATWEELRTVIQGRWTEFTSEDLDKLKGQVNRLVDLVQEKYGVSLEDARRQVNDFEQTLEARAEKIYSAVFNRVEAGYRTARAGVNEFTNDVRNFGLGSTVVNLARHYPVAAMLTAFTLGAAIAGGSVRSRRRRWY